MERAHELLLGPQALIWSLWAGLGLLTIALLILMSTRWGRNRPLRKCVVLSLLAHLLMVGYAATIKIVGMQVAPRDEATIKLAALGEDEPEDESEQAQQPKPWESFPSRTVAPPTPEMPQRTQPQPPHQAQRIATEMPPLDSWPLPVQPAGAAAELPGPGQIEIEPDAARSATSTQAEPITAPTAQRQDVEPAALPETPGPDLPQNLPQPPEPAPRPSDPHTPLTQQAASLPRLDEEPLPAPEAPPAGPEDATPSYEAPFAPEAPGPQPADSASSADPSGTGAPQRAETSVDEIIQRSRAADVAAESGAAATSIPTAAVPRRETVRAEMPQTYQLRTLPDRLQVVEELGGSEATEGAVKAALRWLAANQNEDGRWSARQHGAGRELLVDGQDRSGAGGEADSGVTALAVLAFLGAGHTHLEGEYRRNVRGGLDFLLNIQRVDGCLSGGAGINAAMYCHGMAAFALAEAYGMTHDAALEGPVRRALGYTLSAQHRTTGGWRYKVGAIRGDTSQLGWQLMALKSGELAGLEIPAWSRDGMVRFLKSVGGGRWGGLASYRAGEQTSRTMTAEALFCRQLLGMARDNPASDEAGDAIVLELPGTSKPNLYYWYYATLATYQLQGRHWRRWNEALRETLLDLQRNGGTHDGSWDPDTVWGGYGGRVYSTAMGALCLEVYYRFLPLYAQAGVAE